MKMFAICNMDAGVPAGLTPQLTFTGYGLAAGPVTIGGHDYGLYLFGGTQTELTAIGTVANIYPVAVFTNSNDIVLNTAVTTAIRTKLNAGLTALGKTNIPAGWTHTQIINALIAFIKRNTDDFDITISDIADMVQ